MYCCGGNGNCKGFNGAPLYFQYAVESNDKWENSRCIEPMNPGFRPPVM